MKNIQQFKDSNFIIALIGFVLVIFSLSSIYTADFHLINTSAVSFQDPNGELLIGEYTPGGKDRGVILLEGFGSDQIALKSIKSEFVKIGFHAFSFDFSGQGKSPGILGFDNAATERLAQQVLSAKEYFKTISGLNDSEIILLGHSMGARVALQAAAIDSHNVSGLILIGAQVNLQTNIQAGFFTGVSDTELEWVQNLNTTNPPTDILLLSGMWDDIITPTAANLLYEKLGGSLSPYKRELIIYDFLFHNYEIYSPQLITDALNWAVINTGLESSPNYFATNTLLRKIFWITACIGLFLIPIFGLRFSKRKSTKSENGEKTSEIERKIVIDDINKFLKYKLILWLGAIPIALFMLTAFMLIPIGIPIFSLFYVGFIGSYGLLMIFLYTRERLPGTQGKLRINLKPNLKNWNSNSIITIVIALIFIILAALFFNSGINYVFPLNDRIIWLIIFTILTIPGFYISIKEGKMIDDQYNQNRKYKLIHTIIGLVPFFGISVLFVALGSISGMIGSLQGLLILLFVVLSGSFIYSLEKNLIITIVYQSFLIQFLVLTQGSLFSIFY
ncbi:MAG: alpha/beta fold hydrolase [Candidatus Lokiarchaeota archaeon]|nr:alpha/beta fold hydrolase [Candidatus Lokiarchaeota archaeon]MBD3198544.1 alpha/beta fold hydrolase [Candidatus Lokiarchaeota archaeon]